MRAIQLTTAGESHGRQVTAVLTGIPAGLEISREQIDRDLARRQVGYGRGGRMQIEQDRAEIVGGVRHGRSLGSPICLIVRNRDWENWAEAMAADAVGDGWSSQRAVVVPRPGHADLAGGAKYGHADMRNVLERASARETAGRVAGGAVCRALLSCLGVQIRSRTVRIGDVVDDSRVCGEDTWERVEASDLRCADPAAADRMRTAIDRARAEGDSLGGVIEVVAEGVPPGLGTHVEWQHRLDGAIAQAMLSIPAIKAVEIGDGWDAAALPGSMVHDPIVRAGADSPWPFARTSNHAGGVEGGMSNGERIVVRAAMKPIPTLTRPLASVNVRSGEPTEAHAERSDTCAVPAAGVVGEAMLALVLASAAVEKFGGDHVQDMLAARDQYIRRIALPWSEGGALPCD